MSVAIKDGASTNLMSVDATGRAKVALDANLANAGFVTGSLESDAGTVTGTRRCINPEASADYRQRVGLDSPILWERFVGSALNSALWTAPVTTFAVAVASGLLTLNSGSSLAAAGVARVSSYRTFGLIAGYGLYAEIVADLSAAPNASAVYEWGLFHASGTSAPTDGAFFRVTSTGELRCVVNFNGTETQSAALSVSTLIGVAIQRHFVVELNEDQAIFWIDDVLVATITRGPSAGSTVISHALPITVRQYNAAGISGPVAQLRVASCTVSTIDMLISRSAAQASAGSGLTLHQGQTAHTMGSTANFANSADPAAAAALSNTAALVTGLGGQARFNAAATATTDGIVTSYQNPAATAAVPGKTLMITGCKISAVNLGAAVATTPTVLSWSLAIGHTAVSLATAEAATTKAPRRIALGLMAWQIGAVVGAMPDRGDVYMPFNSPIPVFPGEYVATVAKFVQGTATASQVIWVNITFDGYWE